MSVLACNDKSEDSCGMRRPLQIKSRAKIFLMGVVYCHSRSLALSLCFLFCSATWCQVVPSANPTETKSEAPKDTLGRATPREAVLSFLSAARKGNLEIAA